MPIILVSWEVEIGRIAVPGLPGKKVCETPSQQKKLGMVACSDGGRLKQEGMVQADVGKNKRAKPHLQNNQTKKRTGDVAQTVACLPSKHKVLSTNSSPTKQQKQTHQKNRSLS
jgi:hypothetical protein